MREEGKRLEGNQPAPDAKEKEKWTLKRFWKEWKEVVYVLAAVFVVFKFILQIAWVPSGSMETTLPTRSVLLGWHLTYAVADPMPERGDIITFWSDELGKVLVKRVIGLPGDEITFPAAMCISTDSSWMSRICRLRALPIATGHLPCRRAASSLWAITAPARWMPEAGRIPISRRPPFWPGPLWSSASAAARAGRAFA